MPKKREQPAPTRREPEGIIIGAAGARVIWPPVQCTKCKAMHSFMYDVLGELLCVDCAP